MYNFTCIYTYLYIMYNKNIPKDNMKHAMQNEIHNQSYTAAIFSTFLHSNLVMQYMFPHINSLHVFKITSAFSLSFATKRVKWLFLISNVFAGNIQSHLGARVVAGIFHTKKPVTLGSTVINVIPWAT